MYLLFFFIVDDEKLTEVKKLLDGVVSQLKGMANYITAVCLRIHICTCVRTLYPL